MKDRDRTRLSKTLSRFLRHAPHELGLTLEPGGWVLVDDLLVALAGKGLHVSPTDLGEVVATSDKQRFSFDQHGERIRANQGHSVEVDLQLTPTTPPDVLYHGTSEARVLDILKTGLRPMRRHHVHLSADEATAWQVGARHGPPIVLIVDAKDLHANGAAFFVSENGVWLVDQVPPRYLRAVWTQRKPLG